MKVQLKKKNIDKCSLLVNSRRMVYITKDRHLNQKKILKYIDWAGGPSFVADTLNLSRTTVWRWTKLGFPDTDFSGKTSYAKSLKKLCEENGYKVAHATILSAGRP